MTSRRWRRMAPLGIVATVAVSGCGLGGSSASSMAEMEPVTLSLSIAAGPGLTNDRAAKPFIEQLSKESDKKIEVETFLGGVLFPVTEALPAVSEGRADLTPGFASWHPEALPIANTLVKLAPSEDASFPAYPIALAAAVAETWLEDDDLRTELESQGVVPLSFSGPTMPTDLWCTKPVDQVSDLKGRRVRVAGQVYAQQIEELGMVAVDLSPLEEFDALQRGVLDCAAGPMFVMRTVGSWEVAKYVLPGVLAPNPGALWMMNETTFDSLPEDGQDVVLDARSTLWRSETEEYLNDYVSFAQEATSKHGTTFEPTNGYGEELQDINSEFEGEALDSLKSAGVADPQGFVDDFLERLEYWNTTAAEEFDLGGVGSDVDSYANPPMDRVGAFLDKAQAEIFG